MFLSSANKRPHILQFEYKLKPETIVRRTFLQGETKFQNCHTLSFHSKGKSISKVGSSWSSKHYDRVWAIECNREVNKSSPVVWSPYINDLRSGSYSSFQCAGGNVIVGKRNLKLSIFK